jgi:hypothetical protein
MPGFQLGRRSLLAAAIFFLLLGLAATAARTIVQYQTPGPNDPKRHGLCDFHNGIYYPTRALYAGVSPYGARYAETSPVARQIPFFSPGILVLHTPFAILPLRAGEILYFAFSAGLLLAIAGLVAAAAGWPHRLDVVMAISAALIFTRAGHITLYNGYFTLALVLATFLAIHWGRDHPMRAALALLVVSAKPTYILPLGFLLLARGNVKALVIGAVLSVLAAGVPFAWLAYSEGDGDFSAGIAIVKDQIAEAQEIHRGEQDESPVFSWTRIDLLAVIAKWTQKDPSEWTHLAVMAVLLLPPMALLHQRRQLGIDDGLAGITGAIILTTVLVSLYHQSYDALLMAAPVAGALIGRLPAWKSLGITKRLIFAGLLAFPAYNYLSTRMFLSRLDPDPVIVRGLTSLNGICLAAALVLLCLVASKSMQSHRSAANSQTT